MKTRYFRLVTTLAVATAAFFAAKPAAAQTEEVAYFVKSYVHGSRPPWSEIVMLRSRSLASIGTIRLLNGAHTVAVTPDGERLWVTEGSRNRITVIDATRFEVLTTIDLGDIVIYSPFGAAISPDGAEAWITYATTGEISVWNARTGAWIEDFDVGGRPSFVCFTPDGAKAYVVDYQGPTVTAVRTSDRAVVATRTFAGHRCQDAVISPDGARFYMANEDADQVEVIRVSDDAVLAPIPADDRPRGIAISPDGTRLFVGHWLPTGNVHMYRLSDNALLDTVSGFGNARRLAINPSGNRLFVSDHDLDTASAIVVAGDSMRLEKTVDLNTEPGFLASPVGVAVGRYPKPVPDVKINGSDGPIHLTRSDFANLGLALDANGRTEQADWWVAAQTPVGLVFLTPAGWRRAEVPIYQGRLRTVPYFSHDPISLATWPTGTYVFGLGVDIERNGRVTLPVLYGDVVVMTLSE